MGKFFLERDNSVLLIIDIQERLAQVMEQRQRVIDNTIHLIECAKLMDIPILVTEQYPKGLGRTVKEIRASLTLYKPIEKVSFNCLREGTFLESLASLDRKKIIISGMEAHICVFQTAISLINSGYFVHVVKDAVCSCTEENFHTGIGLLRDVGAVITSTETVLFQLLERAGTKEFKIISQRIK